MCWSFLSLLTPFTLNSAHSPCTYPVYIARVHPCLLHMAPLNRASALQGFANTSHQLHFHYHFTISPHPVGFHIGFHFLSQFHSNSPIAVRSNSAFHCPSLSLLIRTSQYVTHSTTRYASPGAAHLCCFLVGSSLFLSFSLLFVAFSLLFLRVFPHFSPFSHPFYLTSVSFFLLSISYTAEALWETLNGNLPATTY